MFSITDQTIDDQQLLAKLEDPRSGGLVSFAGIVRNHNDGHSVTALEYEVYQELATSEGLKIISEAKAMFKVDKVYAVHRQGHLDIGDIAVWIGVCSAHRDPAFKACRYIIDEIKDRLPIWKKEHYYDQPSHWVNCQGCYAGHSSLKVKAKHLFQRQSQLDFVGDAGQKRLELAKVLVVGMGGLGAPAATYLASAGVGHLTLVDCDCLEASNLHRQPIYSWQDIGQPKVELAKRRLLTLMPRVEVTAVNQRVDRNSLLGLVQSHDLVVDCTDNFTSKFLIHDFCYLLAKPLVQSSVYQMEGQLQVYTGPDSNAGCYRCLWPEGLEDGCVGNCAEVGVLGPVPGILGTWQALEAIKLLLGKSSPATDHSLYINLDDLSQSLVKRPKQKACPLCGNSPSLSLDSLESNDFAAELDENQIRSETIDNFQIVDIREPEEIVKEGHRSDMAYLHRGFKIDPSLPTLLICQRGVRSLSLCRKLRQDNYDVYSLKGGMTTYRKLASKFGKSEL